MKDQHSIDYSKLNPEIFILERRIDVAVQIVSVLKDALKDKNMKKLKCLEIGTSGGVIGNILADHFGEVVGIDVDKLSAQKLWKKYHKKNLKLKLMSAMEIGYKNNSFDVVVTNQDYECVPDAQQLMNEIYRVLKPNGICFFGARNRLNIIEGQYRIPFITWFPENFQRLFLKLLRKESHFLAHYKTYWGLKKLCKKFEIHDYTVKILKQPKKFQFRKLEKYSFILEKIPQKFFEAVEGFIPNYIWILAKKV